jgi:hypothetical protein
MSGDGTERLIWLFQARRIYQHNAGVADGSSRSFLLCQYGGRLLPLPTDEVLPALDLLERVAQAIDVGSHGHLGASR